MSNVNLSDLSKADESIIYEHLSNIVEIKSGLYAISFLAPEIRCSACLNSIKKELKKFHLNNLRSNLLEKKIYFEFKSLQTLADILNNLTSIGFKAAPEISKEASQYVKSKQKDYLKKIGIAGISMMQVMMYAIATYFAGPGGMDLAYERLFQWAGLIMAIPVALYSATIFYKGAYRDLKNKNLGMDVPISLAIISGFLLSLYTILNQSGDVYFDSITMFTFLLLVGRYIELKTQVKFHKTKSLIDHLLPLQIKLNGENISIHDINIGDEFVINPKEIFPADGLITSGEGFVNTSSFTGESIPDYKNIGSKVLAGTTNIDGDFKIRASTRFNDFAVNKISQVYNQSIFYRPKFSILADKVSQYFVGFILMFSALTGLVWYLLGSTEWFVIMLTVLVASCPCALSLATPTAYTIGATVLRKMGVVISNGSFIEKLSIINSIVFDKTGTLTKGNLNITNIILNGSQDELALKKVASALEDSSNHPIASAFSTPGKIAQNVSMHPGNGVSGYVDGVKYYLGHPKFINKDLKKPDKDGLWIILYSSELLAWFKLEDSLRSDAKTAIKKLHESKLRLALYTGDDSSQGSMIANELGITDFCTSVSTEKKQELIMRQQKNGFNVMMVGDGINDTAAMAVANTSIAFRPVDSFVHASADAVMLGGGLSNLPKAIHFSKRVNKTIKQNIGWAITYNFSVIPLAASGIIRPWMAALGMSVSSILVVLNSNKLLVNKWK